MRGGLGWFDSIDVLHNTLSNGISDKTDLQSIYIYIFLSRVHRFRYYPSLRNMKKWIKMKQIHNELLLLKWTKIKFRFLKFSKRIQNCPDCRNISARESDVSVSTYIFHEFYEDSASTVLLLVNVLDSSHSHSTLLICLSIIKPTQNTGYSIIYYNY